MHFSTYQSTGELQNDERTAKVVLSMLQAASRLSSAEQRDPFRRLSVIVGSYTVLATVSSGKIFIVKKQN